MARYKLEVESDGNLGIYCSQPDLWIGNVLEPESSNPALVLEMPVGILGVRKILALFEKWKIEDHSKVRKGKTLASGGEMSFRHSEMAMEVSYWKMN